MKIAVYAISKNEQQFVERFCESAKEADYIYIADTGSIDGTVETARKCGATVFEICVAPWRFDHARNAALALVPKDATVCISLDLDEVLEPGWRQEIERVWEEKTTQLFYLYDWGNSLVFKTDKIHARYGYYWRHPCHEKITPDLRIVTSVAETDRLLVRHFPDPHKSRGQYLDLLALSIKEDPHCPRNAIYYARELTFYGYWADAIQEFERYLNLPQSNWKEERSYAMRLIAKSYGQLRDYVQEEAWLFRALNESPDCREPWCDLAHFLYYNSRWGECYEMAKQALRIMERKPVYVSDPAVWGSLPHDLASIAAYHLGRFSEAVEHAENALMLAPSDERISGNLELMRLAQQKAA